jgi:hypothetical protein
MRCFPLREAKNHTEYLLIQESNSFGDQILNIRYENKQGMQKYVWTEINHEGNWRELNEAFLDRLKALVELDHSKVQERWG